MFWPSSVPPSFSKDVRTAIQCIETPPSSPTSPAAFPHRTPLSPRHPPAPPQRLQPPAMPSYLPSFLPLLLLLLLLPPPPALSLPPSPLTRITLPPTAPVYPQCPATQALPLSNILRCTLCFSQTGGFKPTASTNPDCASCCAAFLPGTSQTQGLYCRVTPGACCVRVLRAAGTTVLVAEAFTAGGVEPGGAAVCAQLQASGACRKEQCAQASAGDGPRECAEAGGFAIPAPKVAVEEPVACADGSAPKGMAAAGGGGNATVDEAAPTRAPTKAPAGTSLPAAGAADKGIGAAGSPSSADEEGRDADGGDGDGDGDGVDSGAAGGVDDSDGDDFPVAAVAGGVGGGLAVLLFAAVCGLCCCACSRRRRKREDEAVDLKMPVVASTLDESAGLGWRDASGSEAGPVEEGAEGSATAVGEVHISGDGAGEQVGAGSGELPLGNQETEEATDVGVGGEGYVGVPVAPDAAGSQELVNIYGSVVTRQ